LDLIIQARERVVDRLMSQSTLGTCYGLCGCRFGEVGSAGALRAG